jgi:hypothetical protein
MKQERDEAIAKAVALEAAQTQQAKGEKKELPADQAMRSAPVGELPPMKYKDITKLTKEELIEWFEDDPKGYEANRFAQFVTEAEIVLAKRAEAKMKTTTVKSTFDQYGQSNPDFQQLWDSGQIQQYMKDHPGITPYPPIRC